MANLTYEVTYFNSSDGTMVTENIDCDFVGNQGDYVSFVTQPDQMSPPVMERLLNNIQDIKLIEDRNTYGNDEPSFTPTIVN